MCGGDPANQQGKHEEPAHYEYLRPREAEWCV
jgi:hypothetical protein